MLSLDSLAIPGRVVLPFHCSSELYFCKRLLRGGDDYEPLVVANAPPLLYPVPRGSCHGTTEEILLFKCLCSFSFCTILGDLESTTNICEGGLERINLSQEIHRGLIARAPVPHRKEQQHSSLLPHYRQNARRCRHVELHGQTANQEKPLLALLLLRALSRQRQSTRRD